MAFAPNAAAAAPVSDLVAKSWMSIMVSVLPEELREKRFRATEGAARGAGPVELRTTSSPVSTRRAGLG